MTTNKRTENEELVLNAIGTCCREQMYGPGFRDIAKATGLPLGTVHATCRDLRDQGRIYFSDHTARSLRPA